MVSRFSVHGLLLVANRSLTDQNFSVPELFLLFGHAKLGFMTFTGRTDKVGFAGDWHGDLEWALHALDLFASQNITTIFHLGDFGIWPGKSGADFILKVQARLVKNGQTMYVTLGNHEDYVRVDACTTFDENGWQVYRPNILLAPRGHRWTLEGRTFLSLGGANSIDRFRPHRIEGMTWWPGEQISLGDEYRAIQGGHADIMLTHDAPAGAQPPFHDGDSWTFKDIQYARKSSESIRQVTDLVKPSILLHGHYHTYSDKTATLNDGLQEYETRVVCLNMNGFRKNTGVMCLEDLDFKPLVSPKGEDG